MTIDFNAVTAIATVLAVLVASVAIIAEGKRTRNSQGIDLLLRMNNFFSYNNDFKRTRRTAGKYLRAIQEQQKGRKTKKQSVSREKSSIALDEVLDFFQMIAMMIRKNALDKELTWNLFSYYLEGYFLLSQEYIGFWRQSSPDYWNDIDWMYQVFVKIEKKKSRIGHKKLSQEELQDFIDGECQLDID